MRRSSVLLAGLRGKYNDLARARKRERERDRTSRIGSVLFLLLLRLQARWGSKISSNSGSQLNWSRSIEFNRSFSSLLLLVDKNRAIRIGIETRRKRNENENEKKVKGSPTFLELPSSFFSWTKLDKARQVNSTLKRKRGRKRRRTRMGMFSIS